MKRALRFLLILLAVAFIGAQFYRPPKTNPPVHPERVLQAPPHVQKILDRSCLDCHSNTTRWPWYTHVAPMSWYTIDHVNEGREELNFSEFRAYSHEKYGHKLEEICDVVKKGEMPLNEYTWLHPSARLTVEDKRALCEWVIAERENMPVLRGE